jgi:hypothetical protein
MDVDEDEDGTQRPRKVQDFGIEVDFESLDDEEREVRDLCCPFSSRKIAQRLAGRLWGTSR